MVSLPALDNIGDRETGSEVPAMSVTLEDQDTIESVRWLASRLKTTPEDALKLAVRAELDRLDNEADFDQGLREVYARMPKLEPTGLKADKAFFDEMSGETD